MPRRDGTGPMGFGTMTGRELGFCAGDNAGNYGRGYGLGLGCRRGSGRGFGGNINNYQDSSKTKTELLEERKNLLQRQLEIINKQLDV